jgi:hypothetical protein
MFQAVPPPIVRSSKLYTQYLVFVGLFLLLTAIVSEFQLTHDSGKNQERYILLVMLEYINDARSHGRKK